jgi:hypothetical protein
MTEEVWKDIKGFDGKFQVSNLGRVRRVAIVSPKILRGYFYADLNLKDIRKNSSIHRLVAKTFIPNPDNKPEVNHKDGDKFNNSVDNLEWMTRQENAIHSFRVLGRKSPEGNRKITEQDVREIRRLNKQGMSRKALAIQFNLGYSTIVHIILGTRWKLQNQRPN